MKKLFAILLAALMLVACDTDNEVIKTNYQEKDSSKYHINATEFEYTPAEDHMVCTPWFGKDLEWNEGYLYIYAPYSVYRYNPETGNVTSLCGDPICDHSTSECSLFGFSRGGSELALHNNQFYFLQQYHDRNVEGGWVKRRVKYDVENQELKILEDIPNGTRVNSEKFYGDYRYFLHTITDGAENPTYEIRREDLTNGEVTVIKELGEKIEGLYHVTADRIYILEAGALFYYTLDAPYSLQHVYTAEVTVQPLVLFDDEFFYRTVMLDDEIHLIRHDLNGEQEKLLCKANIDYMILTEQYIYYMTDEQKVVGPDINNVMVGDDLTLSVSDIYRIPKSGGEAELVYSLPEEMYNYGLGRFVVDGNYLYTQYSCYDAEKQEIIGSGTPYDVMRINLTTGDIYYISK